ncbi:hypothetical protein AX14_005635 [Amanita brunnescens Koide BX004]|nr:hypothetical protein AX14_005635 [Amanita brunnescens Koide BX004]
MIAEISKLIPEFGGQATRTRCFLHVINLVVKAILREFDVPQPGEVVGAANIDPNFPGSGEGGVDDDDDETSEEDNDEGLIDVMDEMDEAEREQVRTDMLPVKQMLSKLQYFETTSWERDWIVTAEEIVRDEYKGSYSDIEVEIPGMEESDKQEISTTGKKKESKNIFDHLPALAAPEQMASTHDELPGGMNTAQHILACPEWLLTTYQSQLLQSTLRELSVGAVFCCLTAKLSLPLFVAPTLPNLAVIQGDFNLHSPLWDPGITSTSGLGERLFYSLSDLELNLANDDGDATWTNRHGACSVIDLLFYNDVLARVSPQTIVDLEGRGRSDHAILFLAFGAQSPHWGRPYIARDSEEEAAFLQDLASAIVTNCHLDPEAASDNITLVNLAWSTDSKLPRIDSNPNSWWTDECQLAKDKYLLNWSCSNLHTYNATTRAARQAYFMHKIDLMTENNAPWEGVRWTKPRPPPKYSTILNNGQPIPDMPTLFNTMHSHFSSALDNSVDDAFIDSLPQIPTRDWPAISVSEINDMLRLTSNCSVPGPDNVSWHHLKAIFDIEHVSASICLMFNNICDTGVWPRWFKESTSIIIPKPKKTDYMLPKAYRPIALLNTLGKLLTKVIANRLQFDAGAHSLLHEGQCGSVQKHATIDAGLALLDFINTNRERGCYVQR